MTIEYLINGKNERLGELFKTPKHLLLYKGIPAIHVSIECMKERFPDAEIVILANKRYVNELQEFNVIEVQDTNSQVETIRLNPIIGSVMFVDCDIVPIKINVPIKNTVYLFENELWMKQYSNYKVNNGKVVDCNEKGEFWPFAGTGIYHFDDYKEFYDNSKGRKSISEVVKKLPFNADTTSKVFRFGTLNDIINDNRLI